MLLIENVTGGSGGGARDHGINDKDDGGDGNTHTHTVGITLAIYCCSNPSEMPQTHNNAVYFIK